MRHKAWKKSPSEGQPHRNRSQSTRAQSAPTEINLTRVDRWFDTKVQSFLRTQAGAFLMRPHPHRFTGDNCESSSLEPLLKEIKSYKNDLYTRTWPKIQTGGRKWKVYLQYLQLCKVPEWNKTQQETMLSTGGREDLRRRKKSQRLAKTKAAKLLHL